MSEVLVIYDTPITGADHRSWTAQACGRVGEDGLWEGWLEFLPRAAEASPVRTGRETTQPNRNDLMYWAQGLTQAYLDGALHRALSPQRAIAAVRDVSATSVFDGPEGRAARPIVDRAPRAVLNPFEVYMQGEAILLKALSALHAPRLRDVAVAYGFGGPDQVSGMTQGELATLILAGARAGLSGGARAADLRDNS